MVIANLMVDLYLPMCHSLKEKRSILKRTIHQLRTRHNIAVAEVGAQDKWGRAELAIVTVCTLRPRVDRTVRAVLAYLETQGDFEVVGVQEERL